MQLKKNSNELTQGYKTKMLCISTLNGYELIDYDMILYLEAKACYTTFFLMDNSKITATKNIGYFEKRLPNKLFIRIHNSIIVNITKVKRYEKADGCKLIITQNNKSLPVSRNRRSFLILFLKRLC